MTGRVFSFTNPTSSTLATDTVSGEKGSICRPVHLMRLVLVSLLPLLFIACKNETDIPFPYKKEPGYSEKVIYFDARFFGIPKGPFIERAFDLATARLTTTEKLTKKVYLKLKEKALVKIDDKIMTRIVFYYSFTEYIVMEQELPQSSTVALWFTGLDGEYIPYINEPNFTYHRIDFLDRLADCPIKNIEFKAKEIIYKEYGDSLPLKNGNFITSVVSTIEVNGDISIRAVLRFYCEAKYSERYNPHGVPPCEFSIWFDTDGSYKQSFARPIVKF